MHASVLVAKTGQLVTRSSMVAQKIAGFCSLYTATRPCGEIGEPVLVFDFRMIVHQIDGQIRE